jgi:hypothetical protein
LKDIISKTLVFILYLISNQKFVKNKVKEKVHLLIDLILLDSVETDIIADVVVEGNEELVNL